MRFVTYNAIKSAYEEAQKEILTIYSWQSLAEAGELLESRPQVEMYLSNFVSQETRDI